MTKIIISALVLLVTVLSSVILYNVVIANRGDDWFVFLSLLCAVTFFMGVGILISGLLAERGRNNL